MNRIASLLLLVLIPWGGFAPRADAGAGRIVDGKVDLNVRFTYREADPEAWRPLFEESSRLLYNATNGQLQFGRIRVASCGAGKADADVWILEGNSGAFANVLGLGGDGHIYLSQIHRSTSGGALGQFGLVHELGHYGFGLYDEYKGVTPPLFAALGGEQTGKRALHQFCAAEDDSVACIMDGGTTIVPNHFRTEFCTHAGAPLGSAHNRGIVVGGVRYENAQETLNGESCWETILRTAALQPPAQDDTADPPGLVPIDWEVTPGEERLVFCLDRSASMVLRPEKLQRTKDLSDLLVGFLHGRKTVTIEGEEVSLAGERLAVVAFADQARVVAPLREMVTESSKDSARAAIDGIAGDASGNHLATDLTAGLRASLDQLAAQGAVPACSEAIVLLSDGATNQGGSPLDLVPELRERGVRVISVGLGKGAGIDLLRTLADSSGGAYFAVGATDPLNDLATSIAAEVRSAGLLASWQDSIGGQDEHQVVLIDSFAEEVTFVLQWDQGNLDLTLTSPSGDVIDFASAGQRQDVEAARADGLVYLRIVHPERGTWDALIHPIEVPGTISYALEASDENRSIALDFSVSRSEGVSFARLGVVADVPVAGAEVSATMDRPSGDTSTFPLFDDGLAVHGDEWANDGVYQAQIADLMVNGTYRFHVTVTCVDGTGPDPDLPFVEDGPGPPESIPPFVREAEYTYELNDLGGLIPGVLQAAPRALNLQNPHGYVTTYLELPGVPSLSQIFLDSIRLNGVPRKESMPATIGDHDADGVPDLMVKFPRGEVLQTLSDGLAAELTLTGWLEDGRGWSASDQVGLVNPGQGTVRLHPDTPEAGGSTEISWPAADAAPVTYSGYLSRDDGATWTKLIEGVTGNSFVWSVPSGAGSGCRLLVQSDTPEGVVGQVLSERFDIVTLSSVPTAGQFRTEFLGASPNPVTGSTTLRFSLAAPANVRLEIYDVAGRQVRVLAEGRRESGLQSAVWDGTDESGHPLSSGAYLYRFTAAQERWSGRLLLVR